MFKKINIKDLEKFTNKYKIKRGIESTNVCKTAQNVIERVFLIKDNSFTITSFKDGILNVEVANSSLLQELKFREKQIIDLILDKAPNLNLNRVVGRIS